MRTIRLTLTLVGCLLLFGASLRFEIIHVTPEQGSPYMMRRILLPWDSERKPVQLSEDGSFQLDRYSFFGLYKNPVESGGGQSTFTVY